MNVLSKNSNVVNCTLLLLNKRKMPICAHQAKHQLLRWKSNKALSPSLPRRKVRSAPVSLQRDGQEVVLSIMGHMAPAWKVQGLNHCLRLAVSK